MKPETSYDIVIHNGLVLTLNKAFDILEPGLICVADGVITRIEKTAGDGPLPQAVHVIDAQGGIVMPGLVNTHTHAAMSLFRGLADDLPLSSWWKDHIFKAEERWLNADSVYAGTRLSCAEMLLSGTTTCCDGYFFEDAAAQAMKDAGIRAIVAQGIVDFPAPGVPDPQENVSAAARFIEVWSGKTTLITPGLFCHSPYTCSAETLKKARQVADEADCLFQIHVAETRDELEETKKTYGATPVQYLDRLGILTHATLLVHAIWVDKDDMASMAQGRVAVSVTTESEMKLGSGVAPIAKFLEKGIVVGIGTDGCASNNNLDMFQEMDTCAKLHKVAEMDPTILKARQVLHMATAGAAQALGLQDRIGSLEVGKRADIIVIDTRKPHMTPLYDPVSLLVYSAGGSDVVHVIVDGRLIVQDGILKSVDIEEAGLSVQHLARQIASTT